MALEVFVRTREDFLPDPRLDPVLCLFYAIENSVSAPEDIGNVGVVGRHLPKRCWGYILVVEKGGEEQLNKSSSFGDGLSSDIQKEIVSSEAELLEALVRLCLLWDADIYVGYEIEMSSWGYVIERAKQVGMNIAPLLSRVPTQRNQKSSSLDEEQEHFTDLDVDVSILFYSILFQ